MKKLSILAGIVLLSLALEGCEALSSLPFFGGGGDSGDVSVSPSPVPIAPNTVPAPNAEGTPTEQDPNAPETGDTEFEDPLVAGEEAELPAPDGLIPITNRDAAVKILAQNQGRPNPFATLPVRVPTATLATAANEINAANATDETSDEEARRLTPTLPVFPPPPIPPQAQQRAEPFTPTPPDPEEFEWEGQEEELEPVQEFNPEELPPLPEPTIANELTVTGVVNLGGSTKAIVQDSEGKSRYVGPGEYLGSGQVLVKRIEMNRGPQPVVVFEELGIEVIRAVGEPPLENNSNA